MVLIQKRAPEYFWRGKGGRYVGLTTLQTICTDCLEIWEPQPPGNLRVSTDMYMDCFYLYIYINLYIYYLYIYYIIYIFNKLNKSN